ncbi:MAG: PEP-CTERM sorting domain-containing protein [Planctomycetota bacterium]
MIRVLTVFAAVAALAGSAPAASIVIDDFSGGVTAANHPDPANDFGVYYDITNDTFGTASDGGGVLRIDDGGFTNGVYVIFDSPIPADGVYQLQVSFNLEQTNTGVIDLYEIGAVVNGVHRGPNPSDLTPLNPADPGTGLVSIDTTPGVSLGPVTVQTSLFTAAAGDNLLVAFGTDLTGPDFTENNTLWNSSFVEIDDITLIAIPEPAAVLLVGLAACVAGVVRRRK